MILRYLGEENVVIVGDGEYEHEEVIGSKKNHIYDCTVITNKNTVRVHAPEDLHVYPSFAEMLKEWEEVN